MSERGPSGTGGAMLTLCPCCGGQRYVSKPPYEGDDPLDDDPPDEGILNAWAGEEDARP